MSDSRQHDRQSGFQYGGRRDGGAPREAGFTLVEILVAFFITAILSLAIYSLFSTTASSLKEADSLASTLDGSRFALERLRSDLQAAGALGTPDMYNDDCENAIPPCVAPNPNDPSHPDINDRRVVGLASYSGGNGWQDYASQVMPSDIYTADGNQGSETGQKPEFDGIVVIGAIDLPYTFELGFEGQDDNRTPTVFPDQRGLWKLLRNDIFDTSISEPNLTDAEVAKAIKGDGVGQHRILRVMDLQGRLQFAGIASNSGSGDAIETNGTDGKMTIDLADQYEFYTTSDSSRETEYGLEPESQQDDKRYPAAFLDAYWYHVIPDPTQPDGQETNYVLVRDRLDGTSVMQSLTGDWSSYDPASDRPADGERVVLADRVVDFQLWVDCADDTGEVTGSSWNVGWAPPKGNSDEDHNCLDPSSASLSPGAARIMHVRLSRRTESERKELPANAFPQGTEHMQAFDIDPELKGAARVYTSQIDFEIPTFAARNITPDGS